MRGPTVRDVLVQDKVVNDSVWVSSSRHSILASEAWLWSWTAWGRHFSFSYSFPSSQLRSSQGKDVKSCGLLVLRMFCCSWMLCCCLSSCVVLEKFLNEVSSREETRRLIVKEEKFWLLHFVRSKQDYLRVQNKWLNEWLSKGKERNKIKIERDFLCLATTKWPKGLEKKGDQVSWELVHEQESVVSWIDIRHSLSIVKHKKIHNN